MKTFYIPTSSLNFNNIFSSESISPLGFYPERKFGYSNWVNIPENALEGVILLYDTLKSFVRPISNVEDHPMVIEIQTDEDFPALQEGVFYSTHTIYLDPWHTKVYFFTEQDKSVVLSLSEHSLETKMLRLYKKKMFVAENTPREKYSVVTHHDNIPISRAEVEKDIFVNKIKGLLYGYYIGASLSTSVDNVRHIHALLEINDIVSAILSNPEKIATDFQAENLTEYLSVVNNTHPLYRALLQQEDNDSTKVERLLRILNQYKIILPFDTCNSILTALSFESLDNSLTIKRFLSQLTLLTHIQNNALSTDASEVVSTDLNLHYIKCDNEVDKELFILWVNKVLRTSKYNGKISPIKMEIANELTLLSRNEYFKEEWETSQEKLFLNALRRHLNGDKFDYQYSNGLLSSLAAVLAKGDDWEQLLRFMRYKEMNDYRLAFALYGVLNGFANLTRDFTDILLEQDSKYVTEVYSEFYGQLFNKKLDTSLKSKIDIDIKLEETDSPLSLKPHFYDDILQYWKGYKSSKKDDAIFNAYLNSCGNVNEQQFLKGLKKEQGFKKETSKAYQYIKSFFTPETQEHQITPIQSLFLFSNNLLDDTSWIGECKKLIIDEKAKKQFEEDMDWLIDNYKENYYDQKKKKQLTGQYVGRSKSNADIIVHIKEYCEKRRYNPDKKVNMNWLIPIYEKVPIEKIIDYLQRTYANR